MSPAPTSTAYCPGLQESHALLIEWLGAQVQAVVRDVQDPNHGVTLCDIPQGGAPRFVSWHEVALLQPGDFTLLDLLSGTQTTLLSYVHNNGPVVTEDWSRGGLVFAYGRLTPDGGGISFHLVSGGADRIITTVSAANLGVGTARVEFSPDDQYIAFGAPSSVSSGDGAAVQIRRLDGTLVFSSGGSGQQTWAGETPRLYFQGPSGVERWDPTNGAESVPVARWEFPIRSAGGRWLAYEVPEAYPFELRIIDTRNGVDRSIGLAPLDVAWVTPTILRFDDSVSCPTPIPGAEGGAQCLTRPVVYDTSDGSKTVTVPAQVFATWPKGTPAWS